MTHGRHCYAYLPPTELIKLYKTGHFIIEDSCLEKAKIDIKNGKSNKNYYYFEVKKKHGKYYANNK